MTTLLDIMTAYGWSASTDAQNPRLTRYANRSGGESFTADPYASPEWIAYQMGRIDEGTAVLDRLKAMAS